MESFLFVFVVITGLGYLAGAIIAVVRAPKTAHMLKHNLILYGSMAAVVISIGMFLLHSTQISARNLDSTASLMLSNALQGDIFSLFAHGFIASIYHSTVYKKASARHQSAQISAKDLETELQRLANLKANGLIDEQDYKTLKDNLPNKLSQ